MTTEDTTALSMDDVWLDRDLLDGEALVLARRRYRIRMVLAIGASYTLDALFLAWFGALGLIGGQVAVLYLLAGWLHVLVVCLLHASGASDRLRNPHLAQWQVAYSMLVLLLGIHGAPEVRSYFFGVAFIVFSFAALRMMLRELLLFLLVFAAGVALVLQQLPTLPAQPGSQVAQIAVVLAFASVLLRTIGLNHYGTKLRLRMFELTSDLERELREVEALAIQDKLTGALNRHVVPLSLEELIQLRRRKNTPAAVAMLDLDHFKSINDRHGHLVGDAVLVQLVRLIDQAIRPTDKLIRFGGEEFLLLMPSSTLAEGTVVVERLRELLAHSDWSSIQPGLGLTVSAGVTEVQPDDTLESVIARADRALYQAKRAGRNRTVEQRSVIAPVPELV